MEKVLYNLAIFALFASALIGMVVAPKDNSAEQNVYSN
jgi:hypothetical protein